MARWGRTTDIEWIYRVTLDRRGRKVSDAYQAPGHGILPFSGAHEHHHPLLRTATGNNNTAPVTRAQARSRYRFPLDATALLRPGKARETMMDRNPWTYQVMAAEMAREGKLESPASPDTPAISDQRDYLYAEVDKATSYPVAAGARGLGRRRARGPAARQLALVSVQPRHRRLVDPARRPGGHDDRAAAGDDAGRHRGGQGRRGPGRRRAGLPHHRHRPAPRLHAAPQLPAREVRCWTGPAP